MKKLLYVLTLMICIKAYSQPDLHTTISSLDSMFFTAYNNCDMETQARFYSDSIEFYHDKAGFETDKKKVLANTQKYICGKVRRELVKGSIEVSPVPGYGAIETGSHMFHNNQEPGHQPKASKFIIIWKNENENWKITRVVSLH